MSSNCFLYKEKEIKIIEMSRENIELKKNQRIVSI